LAPAAGSSVFRGEAPATVSIEGVVTGAAEGGPLAGSLASTETWRVGAV
jgi:hypothetical protein